MEAPTNARELYPVLEESSQADVGEMEQQTAGGRPEERTDDRMD